MEYFKLMDLTFQLLVSIQVMYFKNQLKLSQKNWNNPIITYKTNLEIYKVQ